MSSSFNASAYHKEYYKRNREKQLEASSRWSREHPERIKELARKRYLLHRDEILGGRNKEYDKKYYQAHREERKQKSREWYARNKEKSRLYQKKWRRENKEKCQEVSARYIRSTTGIYTHLKSEARHRGVGFEMEREEFIKWFDTRPKRCEYCGTEFLYNARRSGKSLTVDRKDNDGPYALSNIVLSCSGCNIKKSNDVSYETMLKFGQILREERERHS